MTTFELNANTRTLFGRKTKQLRKKGIVPANIFGKKIKSLAIELESSILLDTMRKAGETGLIHLKIKGDNSVHPVLVSGYAQDPVTDAMLHVDFHEVDLKQKTTATVPLKAVGESEAVKGGMVLVMFKNELEVEALPTELPDSIEVDISSLTEVGSTILAKDLKFDRSKVTVEIGDEEPIATIQEPAKEEVVEATPAEGEAAEGGEKPAEGDAKPADAPAPEAK
ncbi:50S ribosomal protein L25 [Candidatus Woesebacteria bacterium]|nr:50S ribosomal protein L25 [Candidatus Woesebacteria bacterium]